MKRVLNIIVDILVVLVFFVSLAVVSLALTSRSTGVPNILGWTLMSVQTDSMEPTIMTGDLIISRMTDPEAEYEVDDVVTFNSVVESQLITITHRIVDKTEENGVILYTTQGDNAAGQDSHKISSGDIVALWGGQRLGGMGKVMDYLTTQKGFFLCVLLPMIVFFLYILFQFILNFVNYSKAKAVEAAQAAASELTEEQKRKAIEEYLAARGNAETDAKPETVAEQTADAGQEQL